AIGGAREASALQRRNQPFRHLGDEATAGSLERRTDQKSVATDRLHHLPHAFGDRVPGPDKLQAGFRRLEPLHGKLAQRLSTAPLGELVQRPLLAIGRQMRQRFVQWELREVDVGDAGYSSKRTLDERRR